MKKKRTSLEITVTRGPTGETIRARIVAKPSRYFPTRYWVVLPEGKGATERWRIQPSIEEAVNRVARRLMVEANRCFGETGLTAAATENAIRETETISDDGAQRQQDLSSDPTHKPNK